MNQKTPTIAPITPEQQQQVIERTSELLQQCQHRFGRAFKPIDVRFDLRGRSSGMYVLKHKQRYLRFNPFIFAKYFNDSLATTVPHEVAHYVSDILFGIKNIRPHGKEWQAIMHKLGVEPNVTGNYDLSGIPIKQQHRFSYVCDCMTHQLTTTRHNKIIAGKARYFCQKCDQQLNPKRLNQGIAVAP
ncbi:MAG: metallopeptidase (SprT family) [Gammaproteobacteria bacterium]|nr:metallopeptidase (SprT family) [Gammaproteobacteria bacterium]